MSITAKVVADSVQSLADTGYRLTTFELRYPRFIHAELMTHRVFSRNASSSRAIPIEKLIKEVVDDPAMPVWWGKNQAGMQAREELDDTIKDLWMGHHPQVFQQTQVTAREAAKIHWLRARDAAVNHVKSLMGLGLHKQLANRLLEPWSHITVLVTSTDWANWYALRYHPDAQPEMKVLAETMLQAHRLSNPRRLSPGEWHLPYIEDADYGYYPGRDVDPMFLPKLSAGRCARVSFLKHDGTRPAPAEDIGVFDKLMGGHPKHASPTEHQARVPTADDMWDGWTKADLCSNLYGWVQHRKLIGGENITSYEEFNR